MIGHGIIFIFGVAWLLATGLSFRVIRDGAIPYYAALVGATVL